MSKVHISPITKDIVVRYSGEEIPLPGYLHAKIDRYWNSLLESGEKFTRGEVYTITKIDESAGAIQIMVDKTDYAHYLYSEKVGGLGKYAVRIVHPAAVAVSKDRKIILGEMGIHTARGGIFQLCGGGIEACDVRNGIFDIEHRIKIELEEELSIDCSDASRVAECSRELIAISGVHQKITIVYVVLLQETSAKFLNSYKTFTKKLREKGELPEFDRVVALPKETNAVESFLNEHALRCHDNLRPILTYVINR